MAPQEEGGAIGTIPPMITYEGLPNDPTLPGCSEEFVGDWDPLICNPPMGPNPKMTHEREKNSSDSELTLKRRISEGKTANLLRFGQMAMQDDDDDQNRPTPTSPRLKEMAPCGGGGGEVNL